MAGGPLAAILLVGMGIDELSMTTTVSVESRQVL